VIPDMMIRQGNGLPLILGLPMGYGSEPGRGLAPEESADPGQMTVVDINNDE